MQLLDGKLASQAIKDDLKNKVEKLNLFTSSPQFKDASWTAESQCSANERHIRVIVQSLIKPSVESHAATAGIEPTLNLPNCSPMS